MLSLLHPAALWMFAALALPLAIHLWRPPPRTVRLGSLRFLENAPRHPLRNLRWRELLLLCTRLGLLAALSLLLTEPRWTVLPPAGPRRWALLDPTAALAGESLVHWHKAQANGDELRRLVPGLPLVSDGSSPVIADASQSAAPDFWSLLREADAELPAGSTLEVFSPARLAALRGIRPALAHCKVEWFQTPGASGDLPHTWVATSSEKRILEGRSDARSTTFTVKPPDVASVRNPPPPAVSILIFHDAEHAADARYVEAAVRAAADSAGHPVNLQNSDITPDAENAAATDWTFWLSTRPVPEGLKGRAPRIVRYAGGDTVAAEDRIVAPSGDAADGARLWKRAVALPQIPAGVILWSDGHGDPILSHTHPATGERWEFFTRFAPDWTDLPSTTALPASLRRMIFPEVAALADTNPANDRRLADPSQSLPSEIAAVTIPTLAPAEQPSRDLRWPLWTLAALLFAAERVLSLSRRPATPRNPFLTRRPDPVAAPR